MDQPEDALAQSERRVRRHETRLSSLATMLAELEKEGRPSVAAHVRTALAHAERDLELARQRLTIQRMKRAIRL
ncbi:MAG TPA: hypothetical protein VGC80_00395 [Acetobacteraceae bacterium]|jgi:hypothetical protein